MKFFLEFVFEKVLCLVLQPTDSAQMDWSLFLMCGQKQPWLVLITNFLVHRERQQNATLVLLNADQVLSTAPPEVQYPKVRNANTISNLMPVCNQD